MRATVSPHRFTGTYRVPASKSHTIRRLLLASLAEGTSVLEDPLDSLDARSCVDACRAFGAEIEEVRGRSDGTSANRPGPDGTCLSRWIVKGAGLSGLKTPGDIVDVGNSGTTLYLALSLAALTPGKTVFTGDAQIRRRSAQNLLTALSGLGATAFSTRDNGCCPVVVGGPWKGGRVSLECPTSQYLSSLLIAAPLAASGTVTEIDVPLLHEQPYVEMTLAYLDAQSIRYEAAADRSFFKIPGGQSYRPQNGLVGGDFSSAAFPACAAAISGGDVTLTGLDPDDTQGDKVVFDYLVQMGCSVQWSGEPGKRLVTVSRTGPLKAVELDLNATPDALPALAATLAFAEGRSVLGNVPNARIKETDRIAVMAAELSKLGVRVEELPDGLVIHGEGGRKLCGTESRGHDDHRIVMALAMAGLGTSSPLSVDTAEAAAVTYPGFLELLGSTFTH